MNSYSHSNFSFKTSTTCTFKKMAYNGSVLMSHNEAAMYSKYISKGSCIKKNSRQFAKIWLLSND